MSEMNLAQIKSFFSIGLKLAEESLQPERRPMYSWVGGTSLIYHSTSDAGEIKQGQSASSSGKSKSEKNKAMNLLIHEGREKIVTIDENGAQKVLNKKEHATKAAYN